jgi:antitoxin (DNA-binding transcriptional repressor) of toxin-antitoxin stability system
MSTTTIDIRDLPARFDEAMRIAASGQEVVLADAGTPRARLVPFATGARERVPGLHAGSMQSSSDFDAPLADDVWTGRP